MNDFAGNGGLYTSTGYAWGDGVTGCFVRNTQQPIGLHNLLDGTSNTILVGEKRLDRKALVSVLTEPRNALVKQYQRLFAIDGVELEFEKGAIEAIADLATERGTGARGLRAIMEEALLPAMYDVPSREDIGRVTVTKAVVTEGAAPKFGKRDAKQKSA